VSQIKYKNKSTNKFEIHQLPNDVLLKIHIEAIDSNNDFHFPKPILTLKGLRTYPYVIGENEGDRYHTTRIQGLFV